MLATAGAGFGSLALNGLTQQAHGTSKAKSAIFLLVRPRELMTLFCVHGPGAPEPVSQDTPAVALLLQGIESFMAQPAQDRSQAPD